MNIILLKKLAVCLFAAAVGSAVYFYPQMRRTAAADEIKFPENYREWTHVKTAINNPTFASHAGFHHIYANEKALEGYKTGKFSDGAVIVFDVLEAVTEKNGDVTEGKRKLIDVMVKNEKKFKETGGWGYEEFIYSDSSAIKRLRPTKTQCFECHASQKERDYVFSRFRG